MRHRFTHAATVFIAVASTLAVTSSSAGSRTAQTPKGSGDSNQTLAVGLVAEPGNLDFTKTDRAAIPQVLLYNVYEGLVKLNNDGEIIPTWPSHGRSRPTA